jgi:aminoglycoside phosphotransferase (APT) family kinase protein
VLAEELLARVRSTLGDDVGFAEAPVRLGGGFFTANHRFSLRGGAVAPGWDRPLVVRLFPSHAPPGLDAWEAGVQSFLHERGFPAPRVVLHEPDVAIEGRRWFVMELLPGSPALADTSAREIATSMRRMWRDLPRQTAEAHLALHRLDPAPLVESFGPAATVERWLTTDEEVLAPGVDWLREHQPAPRAPLALCHGDSWGGNLLVDGGAVTGLIDWSVATVAEPALEIAFLSMALTLAPVGPRPLRPVTRRVGARLARAYRSIYADGSDADLSSVPYYEAMRCLMELGGVVRYRTDVDAYDGPRPTWDAIAGEMVDYFEARTGVRLALPPAAT